MLQSGFSESLLATFNSEDELTSGYEVPLNDYGYDSDSDLEDDEDDVLTSGTNATDHPALFEIHAELDNTEAVGSSSGIGV